MSSSTKLQKHEHSEKTPISAITIAFNEEINISDCLESVNWCEEIILVDAYSTDQTVKIAKDHSCKIYKHKWQGFAEQKAYALSKASHEWVISLDADERISHELKDEINSKLNPNNKFDGFYIPRKSYFLGKWMKHSGWYPGYQLRLFRKSKTQVSEKRVHEGFLVDGEVGYLADSIIHYTHPTITDSLEKMNSYSSLEAEDRENSKTVHWYDLLLHPFAAFSRKYVAQKGILDGMSGFILAVITAQLKMALYIKLWEIQKNKPKIAL